MSSPPKPASGTRLFYLDSSGVLFCEATQQLHLLNTAGTIIWSLLEEGHDEASARVALGRMSGLGAAECQEYVDAALSQWRERHLLEDSPPAAPVAPRANPEPTVPPDAPPWHPFEAVEAHHFRILGSRFRLRFSSEDQFRAVHPVIGHLASTDSTSDGRDIDIIAAADALIVYRDRVAYDFCTSVDELAPVVKSLIWTSAVNSHDYFLDIHAGVVGNGSHCLLLPAPSGNGKSTLSAALMHAGYEFFSDEVALLEAGSCNVFPLPLAIGIKDSGIDALARLFPEVRSLPLHRRSDGKRIAYLAPTPGSRPTCDRPRPVAALVFPNYAQHAPTVMEPLTKGEALKRLLEECLVVPRPLDFARVRSLVTWISQASCHRLIFGSTEAAVGAIKSVFAMRGAASDPTCGMPHRPGDA